MVDCSAAKGTRRAGDCSPYPPFNCQRTTLRHAHDSMELIAEVLRLSRRSATRCQDLSHAAICSHFFFPNPLDAFCRLRGDHSTVFVRADLVSPAFANTREARPLGSERTRNYFCESALDAVWDVTPGASFWRSWNARLSDSRFAKQSNPKFSAPACLAASQNAGCPGGKPH
jgi:hypothetical protein